MLISFPAQKGMRDDTVVDVFIIEKTIHTVVKKSCVAWVRRTAKTIRKG